MKPIDRDAMLAPRQLTMPLDGVQLRGLSTAERSAAIALLASLFLEAGGVVETGEDDDDGV